jgi:membrane protease YdiL (CAAX protease family)
METEESPLWPAWYAFAGFAVGLLGTVITLGMAAAILGVDADSESAGFIVVGTVVQGGVFVATAVGFAGMVSPPKPWQFGLRATPFWRAVGWATAGMVAFYTFAAVYSVLVHPSAEQTVTQDLGADQGTLGLIVAGATVILIAPAVEEFFFRGFFYKALRTSLPVLAAALVDGLLFGAIHYDFTGTDALLILPPLAALGFIFCLVYEKTGSVFVTMGMHAVNNSIAYAAQADGGWKVSVVAGPVMLVLLVLVARKMPKRPLAGPAPPAPLVAGTEP